MVKLHVKRGDQSLFLYETKTSIEIKTLLKDLISIYNVKLKIERLCYEIEELSKYGVTFPPNMQGLSTDQITELNLQDKWREENLTSLDYITNPDPMGRRNGYAPLKKYAEVLTKTTAEAKTRVSHKLVDSGICLTLIDVNDALDMLKGAIMIVYPMGLPSYEIVLQELEGKEDLSGTQASKEILEENKSEIWWANKKLENNKILSDYVGKNEKSKLIVKLQKQNGGAPAREPIMTEQQRKELMLAEYHRKEELKRLQIDDEDSYLNSSWADNNELKKSFLGLQKIKFK